MKKPKTIIVLIVILLVVIVLAQNSESQEVDFLFWDFSASKFVIYLIFYVIGAVSAFIGIFWRRI